MLIFLISISRETSLPQPTYGKVTAGHSQSAYGGHDNGADCTDHESPQKSRIYHYYLFFEGLTGIIRTSMFCLDMKSLCMIQGISIVKIVRD